MGAKAIPAVVDVALEAIDVSRPGLYQTDTWQPWFARAVGKVRRPPGILEGRRKLPGPVQINRSNGGPCPRRKFQPEHTIPERITTPTYGRQDRLRLGDIV